MDAYSKDILKNIREIEAYRASQKSEGIENKITGNLNEAVVKVNEYGFPYVVYEAK